MLAALAAGLGLSLTPCNWPMYPILVSIILSDTYEKRSIKAFLLAGSYVLGMACAYAILGALAGYLGESIIPYMQNKYVLVAAGSITVLFALSLLGFYDIRMPLALENYLISISAKMSGGKYLGVFSMGVLATLILSPCVTPFLGYALLYIVLMGETLKGALALACFGVGMGVPLGVIGALGDNLLPKAGKWMYYVKKLFGIVLLILALTLFMR